MQLQEAIEKKENLAYEVLLLSRNTLLVQFRFLDAALSQFQYVSVPNIDMATDGEHLFYDASYVLDLYVQEKELPVHNYLHSVLHCIYRHSYIHSLMEQTLWNLSCDIAVEYTLHGLNTKAITVKKEQEQKKVFDTLLEQLGLLTAEKIYRHYLDNRPSEEQLIELQQLFYADNHTLWYLSNEQQNKFLNKRKKKLTNNNTNSSNDNNNIDSSNNNDNASSQNKIQYQKTAGTEQLWRDISERMQSEIENFGKMQGNLAGGLLQNLKAINREKYDYTSFLKKFAVRGEVMKISEDEFDYVFYTYGLKLYEKMPLIEPLEYKEEKRIREFVIAIDTSGSVAGEEVQRFIQKTYNILKSTESFFSKINLHIIQCDADIQEHIKITSKEEFDLYLTSMELKGFGGTDFRPVFAKVDELIEQKEFCNLKGLIYFTDGYGTFPDRKPNYETAFIFVDDMYRNPEAPSWAIKLVLESYEL